MESHPAQSFESVCVVGVCFERNHDVVVRFISTLVQHTTNDQPSFAPQLPFLFGEFLNG